MIWISQHVSCVYEGMKEQELIFWLSQSYNQSLIKCMENYCAFPCYLRWNDGCVTALSLHCGWGGEQWQDWWNGAIRFDTLINKLGL